MEPAASRADNGENRLAVPSFSTARTVREQLDPRPGALAVDWTVSPAHLLGDPSPRVPWLPLRRVWHYRGVSYDTTRCFEKTGMRAQKSFSGAVSLDTAVLRATAGENIDPQ